MLLHVPPGCAVYATNKLLTGCTGVEHSHHALGQSFSHVFEVGLIGAAREWRGSARM